ncbi:MAG: sigma-70 family RNA polymerase sigma factor [Sneathiella sp.]
MQDPNRLSEAISSPDTQYLTDLLIKVAQEQDKQAFAVLFEYFAPRVKSYVFRLGSDDTMAEELAQQAMLQVWRKAHLYDASKAAASTWIFRIARNLRLDHYRKERHFDYDDHDFSLIEDETDSPEIQTDRNQSGRLVRSALKTLPSDQLEVVKLSFYEGLSHGEISDQLNVPLGTVKSRMRIAFKKMKDQMGETS